MALWDLHHLRRLDDMGFVDALYGRRNAPPAATIMITTHDHDHAHPAVDKVTASGAVVSPDCDSNCT